MSTALYLLTGFMIAIAALTIVKPAYVFEYPVAAATLMCVFMLPQAWQIERQGDLIDFDPDTTWAYMILCMIATVVGYIAGRASKTGRSTFIKNSVLDDYDIKKLITWSILLWSTGAVAIVLVARMSATMEVGQAWTGPIAFYAMVSSLFLYATVVFWVLFLHTNRKFLLVLSLIGLTIFSGQFFYGARREGSFVLGVTIILGYYFVKRRMISRVVLLPLMAVGALLVNQAGAIRGHIGTHKGTIIGALSSKEVVESAENIKSTTEVSSAVSDIAIASWSNEYRLFTPFYNQLVNLYVPAFILGRDFKDNLLIQTDEEMSAGRYYASGSTRTGFADTFQSLHYFGCLIFFAISYVMGMLWNRAIRGDFTGQIFYMLSLAAALKVVTESASSFVGVLPLLVGSLGTAFYLSRKASGERQQLARSSAPPILSQPNDRVR